VILNRWWHSYCIVTIMRRAMCLILLWPPYGIGPAIIFLWFLSSSFFLFLLFFPRLISAAAHWTSTILHTWCGLDAILECMSEMCCTWLAEIAGCKNYSKNHHLGTIAQLCHTISLQLRHVSTIGKKLVKQQHISHNTLVVGVSQTLRRWMQGATYIRLGGHHVGLPSSWSCFGS